MRVVAKLALLFFAASCLALAAFGYFAARAEVDRTRRATEAEAAQLGRVIAHAIAVAGDLAGEEGARRIIDTFEGERGDLDLAWSSSERAPSPPDAGEGRVALVLPAESRLRRHGFVTVSLRVSTEREILRAQLPTELWTALLLALAGGALTIAVGAWIVGRPLDRVVAQARRVGAGDLGTRLRSDGTDEIGALKREINAMCDQLEEARRRVEDETAAKTATLEQLRHLDRLRTVGTLASAVAHELGTPLNVLLIHGLSIRDAPEAGPLRETGEAITRQVERMSTTVRSLLDFARQARPARDRVRLAEVARSAVSLVRPLGRSTGTTFEVCVDDDGCTTGDAAQIEQALTNLIVNALHATGEGHIVIRIATQSGVVPPDTSRTVDAAFIEVRDPGKGLDEAQLAQIFEPFYTTKERGTGTGLGLSVAGGIAADHGGWITATSTKGVGSTFTLWFPRTD